ncbi:MAG: hypothetical protein Q9P01_06740 [Anaerolineae bacterium]|nr:hypothetical protein [Anaerolineae bacterium]MDQ7034527.1 hypothetical protein [Anaerolineae bacterium]
MRMLVNILNILALLAGIIFGILAVTTPTDFSLVEAADSSQVYVQASYYALMSMTFFMFATVIRSIAPLRMPRQQ